MLRPVAGRDTGVWLATTRSAGIASAVLRNEILLVLFMVFSPMILRCVILTCIVATSNETQSVKKCCGRLKSSRNRGLEVHQGAGRAKKKAPNGGTAPY